MLLSERNGNKKITVYAETKLHFAHPILKTTIKKEFKMKNTNMIKITVITALLVLALSISAQAGTENPICGTWTFSEYQEKISFYEDGTGMMNEKIVFNWRSGKGYIEIVPLGDRRDCAIICDEEGKLKDYEKNMRIPCDYLDDVFYGDIVVLGAEGEEFTDIPIEFAEWKELVKKWRS